jgi:hypothetical protein
MGTSKRADLCGPGIWRPGSGVGLQPSIACRNTQFARIPRDQSFFLHSTQHGPSPPNTRRGSIEKRVHDSRTRIASRATPVRVRCAERDDDGQIDPRPAAAAKVSEIAPGSRVTCSQGFRPSLRETPSDNARTRLMLPKAVPWRRWGRFVHSPKGTLTTRRARAAISTSSRTCDFRSELLLIALWKPDAANYRISNVGKDMSWL